MLLFSACLIFIGVGLQYAGFRMAVEYNPKLARQLGNLHTAVEIENLNSFYRTRLVEIQAELDSHHRKAIQLQLANEKLIALATPPAIIKERANAKSLGGPYLPNRGKGNDNLSGSLFDAFASILSGLREANNHLDHAIEHVNQRIAWLGSKPIGFPIQRNIDISSPFGERIDPINRGYSAHQGIDFQAPMGALIFSSGVGIVDKAGWDSEYGKEVILNHGDGYSTRYAHASEILVTKGMKVERLTPIAKVGKTGRTTGAHLHFEILKDGKPTNPNLWLVGLRPEVGLGEATGDPDKEKRGKGP
ncbi:M23 family metallopeptidase [Polynucleobacter sp. JS-Safj-400b-B2]|uniref:M23 family metallopeptidase n=1 Tax=Polynucleobacter sp. JS-Safj-400b-B2 TaxID=2576921 RepID=UPI001C0D8B1C|nr:M23 family metallopeptidase [Polynucleobacter sp. JS-Safj-400b-B2]MBU3625344.1 M23 family metallopeptidase [Polynucleobacter sp. JS-Safj-400b-B2]